MAHLYCGSCKGYHASSTEMRACYASGQIDRRNANQKRQPMPQRRGSTKAGLKVIHTSDPVSVPQVNGITWRAEKLGLDPKHLLAQVRTKGEASAVITTLEQRIKVMNSQPVQYTPRPQPMVGQLPLTMVKMLKPGRYALRHDETRPYVFFRVSCPEAGARKGVFKIQTQHGENLRDRIEYQPTGKITKYDPSKIDGISLADWITMLLPVQADAAVDYGTELGRCCRCGTELTDEESRWYGIGPECTKHWPWIHENVIDRRGEYTGQEA